jgi:hypothetical protein
MNSYAEPPSGKRRLVTVFAQTLMLSNINGNLHLHGAADFRFGEGSKQFGQTSVSHVKILNAGQASNAV